MSTAADLWPEEGILQWNICLIPEQRQDAASSILPAPYPNLGATSQSLPCLNSTPHFMLPALCFPAPLSQPIPNPCCSLPLNPLLHPDPTAPLGDVPSFPSLLSQPWEWSTATLSLLCPLALLWTKAAPRWFLLQLLSPKAGNAQPAVGSCLWRIHLPDSGGFPPGIP